MNNQLKQYTGIKTVKARPMTMGEAYECKLAKVLGKTAITSDPTLRQWKRTSLPSVPIKEIYVGNRTYEVNNGFTKRKL